MQSNACFIFSLLLFIFWSGRADELNPIFQYAGQSLVLCDQYDPSRYTECKVINDIELSLPSTSQPYGCTSDPSTVFSCVNNNPECECKDSCLSFETGWGILYPPECLSLNVQLESSWGYVSVYFLNDPGAGVPPQNPSIAPFPGIVVRFYVNASYGQFDVYHLGQNCSLEDVGKECEFSQSQIISNIRRICNGRQDTACADDIGKISSNTLPQYVSLLQTELGPLTIRHITIIGTFAQVYQALMVLKYLPDSPQNTNRLKSRLYNPQFSRTQPYEIFNFRVDAAPCVLQNVSGCPFAPCVCAQNPAKGVQMQLVFIRDVNNAPTLSDPQVGYEEPGYCTETSLKPECHFGQYFSYEDTDTKIGIIGVIADDIDISELCIYPQTECSAADLRVSADHGAVSLNTRDGATFYLDSRGSSGFTAFLSKCNNAIRTIYYQVELTQNLLTSAIKYFNTQTSSQSEFVSVVISDQGSSGASGVSESQSLQILVTIVAVNNAPVITISVLGYEPLEDVSFKFSSISAILVDDVDVADTINSSLLRTNWTFQTENQINLNQLYLSLTVLHGRLTTSYRSGIRLVSNDRAVYITLSARPRHDVCRLKSVYRDAGLLTKYNDGQPLGAYGSICAVANFGSQSCPTGKEAGCVCDVEESDCAFTSSGQGDIYLFLDSTAKFDPWIAALTQAVQNQDKTCGGLPYFPAPNAFSQGLPCQSNTDCDASHLPACVPGVSCMCCANITAVCSANSDCDKFEQGSLCGCKEGGLGYCGPYCDTFNDCSTKLMKQILSQNLQPLTGMNCTFAAPWPLPGEEPFWFGFTDPAIRYCRSPAYTQLGSSKEVHLDTISENQAGSSAVAVIGDLVDMNRAIAGLNYLTYPYYNRRYRPPVSERDPLTFDIAADNLDTLSILVNDLGNSGGGDYDPQQAAKSVTVRVSAVNNAPVAQAQPSIFVIEDRPFNFIATFGNDGIQSSGLQVSDPDSNDYGFSSGIFTVNLSCTNGRLFLNEDFLMSPGVSGNRITYHSWSRETRQEGRGLHYPGGPVFGDGCQLQAQCSDNSTYSSSDTKFGFYASVLYGVVYSPLTKGGVPLGCGFCPDDAGNKFLSFDGTFVDVNTALSFLTYLPDPNFNTRTAGKTETIVFNVTDNGAIGNDASAPSLYASTSIEVLVESVNDRPIIGRKVSAVREKVTYLQSGPVSKKIVDTSVLAINKSLDSYCDTLPPSGEEYFQNCAPEIREYIDIDEDTVFVITPDVLWPNDVDVAEADSMPNPRRYCCSQNVLDDGGCFCGSPCICSGQPCQCDIPEACSATSQSLYSPGEILINISVVYGLLSFYPPPGRDFFTRAELQFLTNQDGAMIQCPDQVDCMRNQSWIAMQGKLASIQLGIQNLFLTYQGMPHYFGTDKINIWVSDQGYTDECYHDSLTATEYIDVRIIGVNDAPQIVHPSSVLDYQQGSNCYADFMTFWSYVGISPGCRNTTNYNIPPDSVEAGIQFTDIDMDATPYGNLSSLITIGLQSPQHAYAGNFFLLQILKSEDIWYEQYRNLDGLVTFLIQGKMAKINAMMSALRYNADPIYTGFLPILINANDNYNFGECDGNHTCGQLNPCANHSLATSHRPVAQGIQTIQLDIVIGVAQICTLQSDCYSCNQISSCGWCPGACLDTGKCMISGKNGPKFEACPVSLDGKGWRMCAVPVQNIALIAAAVVASFLVFLVALVFFLRWVRRRHGSVLRYAKKQQQRLWQQGKKLHLLPPEDANWPQFLALTLYTGLLIVAVFNQATQINYPECVFQAEYFLDQASSMYLSLDTCLVRFVPTRNRGSPDNELPQIKLKIAYTKDPLIRLDTQSCGTNTSFVLENDRDDSTKYLQFYCNIEVLVPDRVVMPEVTIVASGENTTKVRAGPMDTDSPDFGLDFGPNTLSLQGTNLEARLQNVSAKYFQYNVVHGSLIATDLVVTAFGTFSSEDADMIVTTTQQAHVSFWQKNGNLVCLTAAKGSLYAQNNCNNVCKYPSRRVLDDEKHSSDKVSTSNITSSFIHGEWSRRSDGAVSFVCQSLKDGSLNCSRYDPVAVALADICPLGAQYSKRSEVPRITGCYNLDICSLDESAQCLCRPHCDMANLNPPGTCDSFGRCCQTLCAGYSSANLFPIENQPQCGSVIDPVNMPWCNGIGMKQNYQFTSTSGQISVQVLSPDLNQSVSSFNGSAPATDASPAIDFVDGDKQILDELFHPSGSSNPASDVFAFVFNGPGAVESTVGRFLWVKNIHYLILSPWILQTFSLGLLSYSSIDSISKLRPSFCPAIVDDPSLAFNERLVTLRQALLDTLQTYPPGSGVRTIPSISILAYTPVDGLPRKFVIDPTTNQVAVNFVSQDDDNTANFFINLSLGIPGAISFLIVSAIFFFWRVQLTKYRARLLRREEIFSNIQTAFSVAASSSDEATKRTIQLIKGRTGMHVFIEHLIIQSDQQIQKPMWLEFGIVFVQSVATVFPAALAYLGTNLMQSAYQAQICQYRMDFCSCVSENVAILTATTALNYVIYLYFFTAVWEMSLNFLAFKYHAGRKLLRWVFNLLLGLMLWLAFYYVWTILLFIFLGLILKPIASIPYALAVITTSAFFLAKYNNLLILRTRVDRLARHQFDSICKDFTNKLKVSIPDLNQNLLETLIESNIQQVLFSNGISKSRCFVTAGALSIILVLSYVFLFIGFKNFTDANQSAAISFVNTAIVVAIFLLGSYCTSSEQDIVVQATVEKVNVSLREILGFTFAQIKIATQMLNKSLDFSPSTSGEDDDFRDNDLPLLLT